MCISCGCGEPAEDHGDTRHITTQTIQDAASAAGISEEKVWENMMQEAKKTSNQDSSDQV
jgi:hypothetical protein